MRNLKKFLALVLAMMMVMSLMVTANAAVNTKEAAADYQLAVEVLNTLKIVKGKGNGVYGAEDKISRAEFAMMLFRIATGYTKDSLTKEYIEYAKFSDVPTNEWYAGAVGYAASEGLLKGYGNNTYGPNDPVTRNQVVIGLARVLGYDKNKELQGASSAKETAVLVKTTSIADVVKTNAADMTAAATRQEVAQMFFNVLVNENYVTYNSSTGNYVDKLYGGSTTQTPGQLLFDMTVSAPTAGNDDLGRPSQATTVTIANKTLTVNAADDTVVKYTAPAKAADVATALKDYKLEASGGDIAIPVDNTTTTWIDTDPIVVTDGKDNEATMGDLGNTITPAAAIAALTGYGKTVEIYADSNKVINKIVVVNDYLAKVNAVNEANVELTVYNGQAAGTNATANSDSSKITYNTTSFAKDAYVVVTMAKSSGNYTIKSMAAATVREDVAIVSHNANTKTLNGTINYAASAVIAGGSHSATTKQIAAGSSDLFDSTFTFYLNAEGHILGGEVYTEAENTVTPTDYLYVVSAAYSRAEDADSGSGEYGETTSATPASAKATVIFIDGTKTVIDLAVTTSNNTPSVQFPDSSSTPGEIVKQTLEASTGDLGNKGSKRINCWYAYSVDSNGKYTLTSINNDAEVSKVAFTYEATSSNIITVTANTAFSATVKGTTYYSGSDTVVTVLSTPASGTNYTLSHYTGLPTSGIVAASSTINASVLYLIDANTGKITNMYYIGTSVAGTEGGDDDGTEVPEYAYAISGGEHVKGGYQYKFAIKGATKDITVTANVTPGDIYVLEKTDTDGVYTAKQVLVGATSGDINVQLSSATGVKVTATDSKYFVAGSLVYYASNYEVYDVSSAAASKGEASSVAQNKYVIYINEEGSDKAQVIFIVDAPAP